MASHLRTGKKRMKERWGVKEKEKWMARSSDLIKSSLAVLVASEAWLPNETWRSGPAMIHRDSEIVERPLPQS